MKSFNESFFNILLYSHFKPNISFYYYVTSFHDIHYLSVLNSQITLLVSIGNLKCLITFLAESILYLSLVPNLSVYTYTHYFN